MKATCTWGYGPDIILDLAGTRMLMLETPKDRFLTEGTLDLTIQEAEALAQDLLNAAQEARRLEKQCEEYFEQQEERKG